MFYFTCDRSFISISAPSNVYRLGSKQYLHACYLTLLRRWWALHDSWISIPCSYLLIILARGIRFHHRRLPSCHVMKDNGSANGRPGDQLSPPHLGLVPLGPICVPRTVRGLTLQVKCKEKSPTPPWQMYLTLYLAVPGKPIIPCLLQFIYRVIYRLWSPPLIGAFAVSSSNSSVRSYHAVGKEVLSAVPHASRFFHDP